jgi:primosomal protein N'
MPLDPSADLGRRAWLPCPHCERAASCPQCSAGLTCDEHWQYLLSNDAQVLHLQCPDCAGLWDHDTRKAG